MPGSRPSRGAGSRPVSPIRLKDQLVDGRNRPRAVRTWCVGGVKTGMKRTDGNNQPEAQHFQDDGEQDEQHWPAGSEPVCWTGACASLASALIRLVGSRLGDNCLWKSASSKNV